MVTITFQSSNHMRFQNGIQLTHDFVPRFIKLDYSDNGTRLIISILPSLSPKTATIVSDRNNVLTYIGDDPDYEFQIETKNDNTISRISVIRTDRDLELRYYE